MEEGSCALKTLTDKPTGNCLIVLVVRMADYYKRSYGFDSQHFLNYKNGLGLEEGSSSLGEQLGSYLIEK